MFERCGLLLVSLLLAGLAASAEETIWLRGRGSDVWIERGDAAREPRDTRKGLTRVETSPEPAVPANRAGAGGDERRPPAVVVLDGPHWTGGAHYEHEDTPRFYHPHASYPLYPLQPLRHRSVWPRRRVRFGPGPGSPFFAGHPGRGHGRFGEGFAPRPHRHGRVSGGAGPVYRSPGPFGGGVRGGGYVVRGGAYRRVR